MPAYPNFDPAMLITNDGKTLQASGPLPDQADDDVDGGVHEVHVFATVRQPAEGTFVDRAGAEQPKPAVTCFGKAGPGGALASQELGWQFSEEVIGAHGFAEGWV